jgi:hypothetical protein
VSDRDYWLPILKDIQVKWLALLAPLERAIPEQFLNGLIQSGIEPVLIFNLPPKVRLSINNLEILFRNYARWGVHYVSFFHRPNLRASWLHSDWAQADLVERFLDVFLPIASLSISYDLTPIFPPLEPGGDYWDLAFLKASLEGLVRRASQAMLDNLVIGAIARANYHALDWGSGGPEKWPTARPYIKSSTTQDQCGFHIFDWYFPIIESVLGRRIPMILFEAGSRLVSSVQNSATDLNLLSQGFPIEASIVHAQHNLTYIQSLLNPQNVPVGEKKTGSSNFENFAPVPEDVLACHFWLLAAERSSEHSNESWFKKDEPCLPVVGGLRDLVSEFPSESKNGEVSGTLQKKSINFTNYSKDSSRIAHYLLLPPSPWNENEVHFSAVKRFIRLYHPEVGFSFSEATRAARVTIFAQNSATEQLHVNRLREIGCVVDRLEPDGTILAS